MRYLYDDYMAERAEWQSVPRVKRSRMTTWLATALFCGLAGGLIDVVLLWGLLGFIAWWRR